MDNFYKNAGRKIQLVAKAIFVTFSIISVILAIIFFNQSSNTYTLEGVYILLGIICLIGGPLLSWISSLMVYGFGDLVDNSRRIADKLSPESAKAEKPAATAALTAPEPSAPSAVTPQIAPDTDERDFFSAATYGKCQICGEEHIPVLECKVLFDEDTLYRKVCINCKEKFGGKN